MMVTTINGVQVYCISIVTIIIMIILIGILVTILTIISYGYNPEEPTTMAYKCRCLAGTSNGDCMAVHAFFVHIQIVHAVFN